MDWRRLSARAGATLAWRGRVPSHPSAEGICWGPFPGTRPQDMSARNVCETCPRDTSPPLGRVSRGRRAIHLLRWRVPGKCRTRGGQWTRLYLQGLGRGLGYCANDLRNIHGSECRVLWMREFWSSAQKGSGWAKRKKSPGRAAKSEKQRTTKREEPQKGMIVYRIYEYTPRHRAQDRRHGYVRDSPPPTRAGARVTKHGRRGTDGAHRTVGHLLRLHGGDVYMRVCRVCETRVRMACANITKKSESAWSGRGGLVLERSV